MGEVIDNLESFSNIDFSIKTNGDLNIENKQTKLIRFKKKKQKTRNHICNFLF